MMQSLNLAAEVLGFFSGCLLLWPAMTNNMLLRRIALTSKIFKRAKVLKKFDPSKSLQGASRPQWSESDQLMLTMGAFLLVASFGLKCYVVLNT